ncbi:MAG: 4-hydroxy-tetrahydrodipicolinate synthase [Candidatus Cryptobacteroides sp.]
MMPKLLLKGCGTALVTPFRDGRVDYDAYRVLVGRQLEAGIDFLVPLGTTAETPCLDNAEKCELMRITRELCPDIPLVAGAGTNSLAQTLANIRMLGEYGPDAYLVVVPYYNKPTQEGIYEYFRAVAEYSDKPIIVYNVPGRTGTDMTAATILRVARIPGVIAVKEASGNLAKIVDVIREAPEGFSVFSGNDDQTLPLMACGAAGVISVASNIAPKQMAGLVRALREGKLKEAAKANLDLVPLFKGCFVESNPIPVKAALSLMGFCTPEMRLPLTCAVPATFDTMKTIIEDLGI